MSHLTILLAAKILKHIFIEAVRAMIIELHVQLHKKNIGYLYVSRTLQALGIDPGENCIAHGIVQ
jgi:hypothetical protein